ncbi:hypothetical protein SMC26_17650 [Actinomadura fulvescens]|uniref:Uncharacterized protein n=1 Tax=Actinomadura fulvescens TaxID=46160 RepID=A0ABP6C8M6_9ACTN
MAHDPARTRTVSVLVRRVVRSRLVHRLLVLAGILVVGWLIGGAQAHAEEGPAADASRIVARTPVVSEFLGTREAAKKAVRDTAKGVVADTAEDVLPGRDLNVVRPDLPLPVPSEDVTGKAGGAATKPAASETHGSSRAVKRAADAAHGDRAEPRVPDASGTFKTAAKSGSAVSYATMQHPAPAPSPLSPLQAPAQAGTIGSASGVTLPGGFGALLARSSWTAARPRPVFVPGYGTVPPAVRTAADEPSFSPD